MTDLVNHRSRQRPWVYIWGPRRRDAWPPEADPETYQAYRMMRAWLRDNASIFSTKA